MGAQKKGVTLVNCPPGVMTMFTIDAKTGKAKNIEYHKNLFGDKKSKRDDNSNMIKEEIEDNSEDTKETRKKDTKTERAEGSSGDSETGSWKKQQVKKKKGKKFL